MFLSMLRVYSSVKVAIILQIILVKIRYLINVPPKNPLSNNTESKLNGAF